MAQEIREFAVLVPAGTAKAAPLVTNISFPERTVIAVSWRVPPGPSGLMGWALTSAGTPVIPIQQNTFMVTDNQSDTWYLDDYLDSGNWQVTAYNTGIYPHTVYLTFLLNLPGAGATPPVPPPGATVAVVGVEGSVPTAPSSGGSPPATTSPGIAPVEPVISAVIAAMITAYRKQSG